MNRIIREGGNERGGGSRVWGSGARGRVGPALPAAPLTPRVAFQVHPFQRETLQVPGVREGLLPVQDPGGPQNPTHAGEPSAPRPPPRVFAPARARPDPSRRGDGAPVRRGARGVRHLTAPCFPGRGKRLAVTSAAAGYPRKKGGRGRGA